MSGRKRKKIPCPFSSSKMELRNSVWNELYATVGRAATKMNAHVVPRFFICLQAVNTQNTALQGPVAGPHACST